MKTPDGREFTPGLAGKTLGAAWRAVLTVLRLVGKVIATIWRLAGALDSALWRGVKLAAGALGRGVALFGRVVAGASRDLVTWLPTRAGRAYSAACGVVLIVAGLWIVDYLRVTPSQAVIDSERLRPPTDREDPILARIDGRYIHLSEVAAAARATGALRDGETLTARGAFDRALVDAYAEQRLLARAASEEGLHRSPDVSGRLAAARERILAAAFIERRLAASVTDAAVERLYRAQSDVTRLGDEVRARHILVETGEEARQILTALEAGGDFAALARELSRDRATAPLGGEIGYFTRDMMAPAVAAAAFSVPPGEIAPPFQTEHGWHVLEVLDRRATDGVPLEAVRDNIRRFLTLRTIETTLAQLKQRSDLVYYHPDEPAREAPAAPEEAGY